MLNVCLKIYFYVHIWKLNLIIFPFFILLLKILNFCFPIEHVAGTRAGLVSEGVGNIHCWAVQIACHWWNHNTRMTTQKKRVKERGFIFLSLITSKYGCTCSTWKLVWLILAYEKSYFIFFSYYFLLEVFLENLIILVV